MSALLAVGAPTVRQSVFGDWLVDDGSSIPTRTRDSAAAFAEAAARTQIPADACHLPRNGGQAPGSVGSPPETIPTDLGAPNDVAWPARARQGVARPAKAGAPTG